MVDERDHNSNWRRRVSVRLSFFLMKNGKFNLTSGSGGAPPVPLHRRRSLPPRLDAERLEMMIRIAAKTNKLWKLSSHTSDDSQQLLVIASFNTLSSSSGYGSAHLSLLYTCRPENG